MWRTDIIRQRFYTNFWNILFSVCLGFNGPWNVINGDVYERISQMCISMNFINKIRSQIFFPWLNWSDLLVWMQMSARQVQATLSVKSENFQQTFEESLQDSTTPYASLIAANERLRASLSKTLTEFVDKARAAQQASTDPKKRKIKCKIYLEEFDQMIITIFSCSWWRKRGWRWTGLVG